MTHRVSFRPEAMADLNEIFEFIVADSPAHAKRVVEKIYDACLSLSDMPLRGPARDDIVKGLRILPIDRSFVVAYRVQRARVDIINVFYGGRDYEALLRDRGQP